MKFLYIATPTTKDLFITVTCREVALSLAQQRKNNVSIGCREKVTNDAAKIK